jgi:hypothetical protein
MKKYKTRKLNGGNSDDAYDPQILQNMQNQRLADDLYNKLNVNCTSYKSDEIIDLLQKSCSTTSYNDNIEAVNYLYTPNIRGGYKKMASRNNGNSNSNNRNNSNSNGSQRNNVLNGGCLTCPKGKKKLQVYYRSLVVLMPKLYKVYKDKSASRSPTVSTRAVAKKATRVTTVARAALAARATRRPVAKKPVRASGTAKPAKKAKPVAKRTGYGKKKRVRGGDRLMDSILNTSWLSFKPTPYVPENMNNQIASLSSKIF